MPTPYTQKERLVIKAIETVYNGYRFRSRLEARWAVFFDELGIEYEYEPEGFDLGEAGYYLPDFWLPEQKYWIEIKGKYPTNDDVIKVASFSQQNDNPIALFWSQIDPDHCANSMAFWKDKNGVFHSQEWYAWHYCNHCHHYNLLPVVVNGEYSWWLCPCRKDKMSANKMLYDASSLLSAYTAARQARFEHGQIGAPSQWQT